MGKMKFKKKEHTEEDFKQDGFVSLKSIKRAVEEVFNIPELNVRLKPRKYATARQFFTKIASEHTDIHPDFILEYIERNRSLFQYNIDVANSMIENYKGERDLYRKVLLKLKINEAEIRREKMVELANEADEAIRNCNVVGAEEVEA